MTDSADQQPNMDIVYRETREQMTRLEQRANAVSSRLLCALSGESVSAAQKEGYDGSTGHIDADV